MKLSIDKKAMNAAQDTSLVQGYVDGILCGLLTGWLYDPDNNCPEIELFVDGKVEQITTTTMRRDDVVESLSIEGMFGFSFDLDDLPIEAISNIQIRYRKTFNFNGVQLRYCPLVEEMRPELEAVFFTEYYRDKQEFHNESDGDVFRHYLNYGIYEGLDPNPWFSSIMFQWWYSDLVDQNEIPILAYLLNESELNVDASEEFSASYYVENNALESIEGSYLAHYVKRGQKNGLLPVNRILPEAVRRETLALMEIEPALAVVDTDDLKIVKYPKLTATTYLPGQLKQQYGESIKVVVCVPYISCGGADLISTYVLKAYQEFYGSEHVLLVVTDRAMNEMPQWIDEKSNIVFLAHETETRGLVDRVQTLHTMIGRLCPERVFNVNSQVAWEMYGKYGAQLSQEIDLNAYLFCFDYDAKGRQVGYIKDYVPKTIQFLNKVYCDNATIISDIQHQYGFSSKNSNKFETLYVPAGENAIEYDLNSVAGSRVLWSGRLARQKRPEVLVEIAKAIPTVQFDVYGPMGDSHVATDIANGRYDNIVYKGVYQSLTEIDFNKYCLFLNTSAWEGLPTVIIQIMSIGLPIVSSSVGGISELLDDSTGFLIEDNEVDHYSRVIKSVLVSNKEAKRRSVEGKGRVKGRHCWENFYSRLEATGAFNKLDKHAKKRWFFDRRRYA